MTATALDPLAHVLGRAQQAFGSGAEAEDCAVAVATRFLTGGAPGWLHGRSDAVRLDVLTMIHVLDRRRTA